MSRGMRSQGPLKRAFHVALCAYITFWLAGCASAPPKPEGDKLTQLQVRRYPAPFKTVFNAAIDATQNMEFSVDLANVDAGVITATRQTNERLARITSTDDKGLPTWAWVLIIATGVIIIAAVVVALSSHDDEKDKDKDKDKGKKDQGSSKEKKGHAENGESGDKEKSSRRGGIPGEGERPAHRDTVRVKYKERSETGAEAEHHHRERTGGHEVAYYGYDEPQTDFIVISDDSPQSEEWHQYRITLHFDSTAEAGTIVRMSAQGANLDGSEVEEAGPVYDPQFYDKFFSYLERSLRMEMPDSSEQ
jgi:hypothetical protein